MDDMGEYQSSLQLLLWIHESQKKLEADYDIVLAQNQKFHCSIKKVSWKIVLKVACFLFIIVSLRC